MFNNRDQQIHSVRKLIIKEIIIIFNILILLKNELNNVFDVVVDGDDLSSDGEQVDDKIPHGRHAQHGHV